MNQRFVATLEELYDDARRAQPAFAKAAAELAAATGGAFLLGAEKKVERARMKALFKYSPLDGRGVPAYLRRADCFSDDLRRRRGYDVDSPRRRVAATPRPRRG